MAYIRFYLENTESDTAQLWYFSNASVTTAQVCFSGINITGMSGGQWDTLDPTKVSFSSDKINIFDTGPLDNTETPTMLGKIHYNATDPSVCFVPENSNAETGGNPISTLEFGINGNELCALIQSSQDNNSSEQPPTATIELPTSGEVITTGSQFTYRGSAVNPEGYTVTYAWDMGDGTFYNGSEGVHTYSTDGDATISLQVVSDGGDKLSSPVVSTSVSIQSTVSDTTPPVINLSSPNPQSLDYGVSWVEPGYTATDDVDGDVTDHVVVTGTVDEVTAGDYTITYTVSDSSGNQTVATRTVQVQAQPDTNAPVITLLGQSVESTDMGTPWSDPGYTATDDMDGDLTSNVTVGGDYVDYSTAGSYSVTYSVFDAAGNEGTASRTVVVEDLALSVVVSVDSADVPSTLVTYGASITTWTFSLVEDSSGTEYFGVFMPDTSLAASPKANSSSNNLPGGDYTWTLTGTSGQGQTISGGTGTLTVASTADTVPPVITLSGKWEYDDPQMVDIGDPWIEPGVSATDAVDGTVTVTTDSSALNVSTIGTYYVNYTATDSAGNTATAQRTIVVCDNASPVLTLIGQASVTVEQGSGIYSDPGATAIDGGGDISDQIVVTGSVDTNTAGSYTLEYNVSDASGNDATPVSRSVTVNAVYPTITLTGHNPAHVEVYGGVWSDPGFTASDVYDGDLTSAVTVVDTVDDTTAGDYTVTYTVTNSLGNETQLVRNVTVGVHACPVVEDLSVPQGTPNLSGIQVTSGNTLNYNGTTIDISTYTSGMWQSLAQNVGLSATAVTASALDVSAATGIDISNTSVWQNFPINDTQSFNVSDFVSLRTFPAGIGTDPDGSSVAVEETVIKFVAYQGERRQFITNALNTLESLADEGEYPFSWHCALNSKFVAQDIVIMASPERGIKSLAEDTGYPQKFVEYRLSELYMRKEIDGYQFADKVLSADTHGFIRNDGSKIGPAELATESPEAFSRLQSALTSNVVTVPQLVDTPIISRPRTRSVLAGTGQEYDLAHNPVDPNNPSQTLVRSIGDVPIMPVVVSEVIGFSGATITEGLSSYVDSGHLTPEFLGGLYAAENTSTQPRSAVLTKITEVASANGVDISAYTGG